MKRRTAPAAAGVLAGLLLLCCACGAPDAGSAETTPPATGPESTPAHSESPTPQSPSKPAPPPAEQPDEPFRFTERMGCTAVVTEPAALTRCFSYTYRDADDRSTYRWEDWDEAQPYTLRPGDLVLVLEEADGLCRAVVPYGDLPWVYGFLPAGVLSTEPDDLCYANQAILQDCPCYDAIDGTVLDTVDTKVVIQWRHGDWALVRPHAGGEDGFWVPTRELSFDFDAVILDRSDS